MKKWVFRISITIVILAIMLYKTNILINKQEEKERITSYIKYASTYNYYYKPLIVIPKINLKSTVIKASNDFSNLDKNLVYYKYFDPNDKIVIFGHSGAGYGTYFSKLNELQNGDILYVYYEDACYKYSVYDIKYIDETNLDILNIDKENSVLYLVTCTKKDKNKRLLVKLRQENSKKAQKISKK